MSVANTTSTFRYVVLRHDGVDLPHFDLMFETAADGLLATWRSQSWPVKPCDPVESIDDHRRSYLDYEGPVSGNRGQVYRVASGSHRIEQDHPGLLVTALEDGTVLHLFRTKGVYPARISTKQV